MQVNRAVEKGCMDEEGSDLATTQCFYKLFWDI